MIAYCTSCGAAFTPRRHYYHQCFPCWHEEAGVGRTPHDAGAWREGYEAGRQEGFARGVVCGRAEVARQPARLSDDLLLAIVRLVHPDRHPPERFAECNRVTATVLALRATAALCASKRYLAVGGGE